MEICDFELCTGCSACYNSCTHGAITMRSDEFGFIRPLVDDNKCVSCCLCQHVCPVNYPSDLHVPIKRFVAFAINQEEQFASTSGGIASAVCRFIIRQGGVVYGCSAMDYHDVHHVRIADETGLDDIRGSKYVQSRIGEVYKQVKDDLLLRKVAFVGSPCQVAGLHKYLHTTYNNLITMDFVCHGVPSNNILVDAIDSYNMTERAKSVFFRKKKASGDTVYGLFVRDEDGKLIIDKPVPADPYTTGFLSALFYRPSCYKCKYAQVNRPSDLTLGDYREGKTKSGLPAQKQYGLSLVLANTDKGISLLNEMGDEVAKEEQTGSFVPSGQLKHPMPKHVNYDAFKEQYLNEGYEAASLLFLKPEMRRLKRNILIGRTRDVIFKIPLMEQFYHIFKPTGNGQ